MQKMEIGDLYELKQTAKFRFYYLAFFIEDEGPYTLSINSIIIPLEFYENSTIFGQDTRRTKVLLTNGKIGTMFLSANDWQKVTLL